jgi:hypothetical protein
VKRSPAAEVPPAVLAVTVTVPGTWAGEVTRICVLFTKVAVAAGIVVPPNVTVVAPETKSVPVRVTVVPPEVDPEDGATLDTVGAVGPEGTVEKSNGLMVLEPEVVKFVKFVVGVR